MMKRNTLGIPCLALTIAGAVVLTGCKPAEPEEEKTVTEVAVQVGKVTRVTLHARVDTYGTVEAEPATADRPAASARIASPSAGIVMEASVSEGQQVKKGAVLFRLDTRAADATIARAQQTVERARPAIEKAKQGLKFAELNLDRQQRLVKVEGTSQKLLQDAEAQVAAAKAELGVANAELAAANAEVATAETQRGLLTIAAPFAGTFTRVHAKPGEAVELNTVLAELVDLDRLVVSATVPGDELTKVKIGHKAEILSGDKKAAGAVAFISPEMDAKTGTALVRVSVPGDAGVRPGQFVRLRIVTEEHAGKLAVPREAVYTDHDGQSTLSIVEGDVAKQITVKAGLRDGDLVEVEGDGVSEGATVVTLGSYALPKETKIRILNAAKEEAK
jgi:membrane fusion protein (multidrug efflux system)